MHGVEPFDWLRMALYQRVRRACHVEGVTIREAARAFGLHRDTVRNMLMLSLPPGYRRSGSAARPKLDPHHYPGGIENRDGGHSCLLVLRVDGTHRPGERTGLRRGPWPSSYEVTARLAGGLRWAAPRSSRQITSKALRRSHFGSGSTRGGPARSSQSQSC